MNVFCNSRCRSSRVFLKMFDKFNAISKDVDHKFCLVAEDKKKVSSALPQWGQVYRLGDQEKFHKALKVNKSFSRHLTKQVSASCSLSLWLDDSAKLESCIRGQIEWQSFSLWAIAAIFEFLKESHCVPDGPTFHQLVSSMTHSINSQARASLSTAVFLKQKRREAMVAHLPSQTHNSIKLDLLSTPSSSLFSEEIYN